MSTTNDTPAEYGDSRPTNENGADGPGYKFTLSFGEQPKREPLMKDDEISRPLRNHPDTIAEIRTAKEVRDWYENEITEGRLMVVKECRMTYSGSINEPGQAHPVYHHEGCPDDSGSEVLEARVGDDVHTSRANFCPGCGAKIIKG